MSTGHPIPKLTAGNSLEPTIGPSGASSRAERSAPRTPELGGRLYQCRNSSCRKHHYAYHSCNHRNCPQCGSLDQQHWSVRQEARLLRVPYFLITFTIPAELRSLCLHRPAELYGLLLKCSARALHDVVRTKFKNEHLQLGLTSVLHTWGRQMQHHPHVHAIVPAVAYDLKGDRLIHPAKPDQFLIHFRPLANRFRSLVQSTLQNEHPEIQARLTTGQGRALSPATSWNVQLQPAGQGRTALRYLARYVHRSAFHPKRLLGSDAQGRIKLLWTHSTTKRTRVLRLHPRHFLQRWLLHVLPKGFTRVRHYGFLAAAATKARQRVRHHLRQSAETVIELPEPEAFTCEHCGSELKFLREIPRLTYALRGPPS